MEGIERTTMSREQQADAIMSRFLSTLQQISATMESQAQANSATQENNVRTMQGVGEALENLVANSKSTNQNSTSGTNRIIDLAEFNGADRSLWPSWKIQAEGKAKLSGSDPSSQFYAIFNKLRDNAVKNVTPWVTQNLAAGTATYEGLLTELSRLYDDPAQEAKALSKLKSMKQLERESFSNFFPKFEKELANAGGTSIGDQIKIMFLRTALSSRFRNCLPKTKHYTKYEELIIDLQNAAATMANEEALFRIREIGQIQSRFQDQSLPPNLPASMDWTPTVSAQSQNRVTGEINQRPRARWVSRETIAARREANCCLRCGNSKHYQQNCPYRPPINPNRPISNNQRGIRNIDQAILMAEPELNSAESIGGDISRIECVGETGGLSGNV